MVATEIFVTRFRKGVHVRVPSCFDLFLRLRRSALRHGCWRWIAKPFAVLGENVFVPFVFVPADLVSESLTPVRA